VSERAEALQRVDDALEQVGVLEAALRAARRGETPGLERAEVQRRLQLVADARAGDPAHLLVQELATLAARVVEATNRTVLHTERDLEVVQQTVDVLSLLLRDMGHRLLGRRRAEVGPAAAALRDRLERTLLVPGR